MSMKPLQAIKVFFLAGTMAALAISCATTNKLDMYSFNDAPLATDLRNPPPPTVDVHYRVTLDAHDPVGTVLSIGTSYGKAQEAAQAEERMRDALSSVDVPGIIVEQTTAACTAALGARRVDHQSDADFLLDLQIDSYGLHAGSAGGSVSLRMNLTARLHSLRDGELIWRRDLRMDRPMSPALFGGHSIVGNVVTAAVLANLTTEEMAEGFRRLAEDSATWVGRTLEDDFLAARRR
jgi:hypothetical protein